MEIIAFTIKSGVGDDHNSESSDSIHSNDTVEMGEWRRYSSYPRGYRAVLLTIQEKNQNISGVEIVELFNSDPDTCNYRVYWLMR